MSSISCNKYLLISALDITGFCTRNFIQFLQLFSNTFIHIYKVIMQGKLFSNTFIHISKVIMQGKLFQRCTHLLYCNGNTRRMQQPDMGSIFPIKKINEMFIGNWSCELSKLSKLNAILSSSGTKQTLTHLFLFTNSSQTYLKQAYWRHCVDWA